MEASIIVVGPVDEAEPEPQAQPAPVEVSAAKKAEAEAESLLAAADVAEAAGEPVASTRLHHCAGLFAQLALVAPAELAEALREKSSSCRARALQLQAASAARAREEQLAREATAEQARLAAAEAREAQRLRDRPSPMAAVAALGAGAAFLYSGPLLAVAAAASVALGTYRQDGLGDALRATGETAADAVSAARGFNREHEISVKAKRAAAAAVGAVTRVEDALLPVAPNVAALVGTTARAASFAVEASTTAMVAGYIIGDSEAKKP